MVLLLLHYMQGGYYRRLVEVQSRCVTDYDEAQALRIAADMQDATDEVKAKASSIASDHCK